MKYFVDLVKLFPVKYRAPLAVLFMLLVAFLAVLYSQGALHGLLRQIHAFIR